MTCDMNVKPGTESTDSVDSLNKEIQHLTDELHSKQLDLEIKCQSLQETLEELEESRNRYAALYDFAPVGYVTFDDKGCILEINLTGATMVGMERSQLIDMPMLVIVFKSDMKRFLDHLQRCRQTNEKVITELSLVTKSGTPVQVQLLSVPFYNTNDKSIHYKTIITDFTERRLFEKELSRLDRLNLVGEIAASIAHEIRNPMTTIRGFLQLFSGKSENAQYKEHFDMLIAELDRTNALITEFLSLAKNKVLNLEYHNLNVIIKTIYPLIHADGLLANMNVMLELGDIPDLLADEQEIRQLIINLVRNSMQAMPSGGNLNIKTFMDGETVVLVVQDQGAGIPPKLLDKLGTPFLTTKKNGTGLGLAICYSIAARHNAAIKVKSDSTGTTFFDMFKL